MKVILKSEDVTIALENKDGYTTNSGSDQAPVPQSESAFNELVDNLINLAGFELVSKE